MHRLVPALVVAVGTAMAQEQATFEVASVKASGPHSVRGSDGGPGSKDPGRYSFGLATLMDLIVVAYEVDSIQISSKTPLDQQRFDLVAKVPAGATMREFRAMLRHLLEERFHLKTHMESKQFPAYELVIAKTGLKLRESTGDEPDKPAHVEGFPDLPQGRPGLASNQRTSGGYILFHLRSQQEPVAVLARMIREPGGPPVVDKTGLTGKYSFTVEYTRPLAGATAGTDAPPAPDLFAALQQQLGLQLVAKKLAFDVVVVDSVDKLPTEN